MGKKFKVFNFGDDSADEFNPLIMDSDSTSIYGGNIQNSMIFVIQELIFG